MEARHRGQPNWSETCMPTVVHSLDLYIDELSNYIENLGGSRTCLKGIPILLYTDGIMLVLPGGTKNTSKCF